MTTPTTQIILPSQLTFKIDTTNYQFNIHYIDNKVEIQASNCYGTYFINSSPASSNNTQVILSGSGGGNLLGIPSVILLNMSGSFKLNDTHILKFTTLCQITISGNCAKLSLSQSSSVLLNNTSPPLIIPLELTSTPCISVIYTNNTRYISIGCLEITFIF
jgi:hypothetical protein